MGRLKALHRGGQSNKGNICAHTYSHPSARGFSSQPEKDLLVELDRAMGIRREQLPVPSQLDAVSAASKQLLADDFFQPQHLLTDSRLRLVEGHCGLSDTPLFHKSQKRAQKAHFH